MFKIILFLGIVIFFLLQFYQPTKNVSLERDMNEDITNVYAVPKNVKTILRTSCYDCHSNNTNYPLYSYIQPVRIFMESHINEGKENLNFNEFGNYSKRRQENKFESIIQQISSDQMPLASYTLLHQDARLTPAQKKVVIDWISLTKEGMSSKY